MSPRDPIHELKNHLSIILGFAELMLAETSEGDKRREDLLEIKQAADHAMTLTADLTAVPKETE